MRTRTASSSGAREELATPDGPAPRRACCAATGARVDRVKLRYRSRPIDCAVERRRPGSHDELWLELDQPAYGVAPGQTACLMDGEMVVGHATIAS